MPRPLQTRQIGLRPHHSGHPLAPMEIVYEVEKRKPRFWTERKRTRATNLLAAVMIGASIIFAFAFVNQGMTWVLALCALHAACWAYLVRD